MLHRKEENSSKKEWLGDIVVSSKWLLSIMNRTLEVISKGSDTLKLSEFNVHDVLKETIGLLQAEIHRKGLEVTSSCPDAIIMSDRTKLSRILINLLGNAVKYTEKGSIKITVTSVTPLQISIEDTGIGIPEDSLEIIFGQFTRLKPSNVHTAYSGAGVGLYLARSLANDLGGDIAVKSEVGQGSCFTLMLKN
jgi:signal transduction histidine kinase